MIRRKTVWGLENIDDTDSQTKKTTRKETRVVKKSSTSKKRKEMRNEKN